MSARHTSSEIMGAPGTWPPALRIRRFANPSFLCASFSSALGQAMPGIPRRQNTARGAAARQINESVRLFARLPRRCVRRGTAQREARRKGFSIPGEFMKLARCARARCWGFSGMRGMKSFGISNPCGSAHCANLEGSPHAFPIYPLFVGVFFGFFLRFLQGWTVLRVFRLGRRCPRILLELIVEDLKYHPYFEERSDSKMSTTWDYIEFYLGLRNINLMKNIMSRDINIVTASWQIFFRGNSISI